MGVSSEFEVFLSVIQQKVISSDLLTESYARYRPLLGDALRFFLERLSTTRLRSILNEQTRLPADTSTGARVAALLLHVPALHKLGQVVSRDRRLDPHFRRRLQTLESLPPRVPMAEILRAIGTEFPGWARAGVTLESRALAEGSVAVVIPFTWRNRRGVIKILKPGINEILDEDLEVLGQLGDFLDRDCARYHLPQIDYQDKFSTIRDLLMHEVHLDEEQANLAEAAHIHSGNPDVLIPKLFPFCSPTLTAMERVEGRTLGDCLSVRKEFLAQTIAQSLIAQPLFSADSQALFHADPHAGNLLVTADGRLAILDWSLGGRLRRHDRVQLAQMLLACLTLNQPRLEQIVQTLTHNKIDLMALHRIVDASMRTVRWGERPGIAWLTNVIDNLAFHAGAQFNNDLLLFRKSMLTLDGVLADVMRDGCANHRTLLDRIVMTEFCHCWMSDWPRQLWAPTYRSRRTHLSSADVLSTVYSLPVTLAKWWMANSWDLVQLTLAQDGTNEAYNACFLPSTTSPTKRAASASEMRSVLSVRS